MQNELNSIFNGAQQYMICEYSNDFFQKLHNGCYNEIITIMCIGIVFIAVFFTIFVKLMDFSGKDN